jgi:hypothetical protein
MQVVLGILAIMVIMILDFVFQPERSVGSKPKTDIELWQEHVQANQCKIIERHDGYSDSNSGVGMTTRGSGVILGSSYHSAQDLWQCADGVKHFKAARFAEQTTTQK